MNRDVRQRLARLPLFCRLFAEQLAELADDEGRIDIGDEDPAQALGRMLGAHTGERRLLRGYVPELIDVGFMVRDGRWLRVGARASTQTPPPDANESSTNRQRVEHEPATSRARTGNESATNSEATSRNDSGHVSRGAEKKASIPAAAPPPPAAPSPSPSSPSRALPLYPLTPSSPPTTPVAPGGAGASRDAQPGLFEAPTAPGATAAVAKGRRKRAPDAPAPLPFTVADVMQALADGSGGQVVTSPFDPRLAPPITTVIRTLAAQRVGLEDVRLVGECYAAGGLPREQVTASWVAQTGRLANAIGVARAWRDAGRRRPGALAVATSPAASRAHSPVVRTGYLTAATRAAHEAEIAAKKAAAQ